MSGEQNFLNAVQNYADLKGQQTNLFKCFLPQAWMYNAKCGVSAFIHPEGVYDDPKGGALMVSFDTISNLYDAKSIVECFEGDSTLPVPGIKDVNGEWNVQGHPARIIHVTKKELAVFAKLFDGSDNWKQAKLPVLHTRDLVSVLSRFAEQEYTLANISEHISVTQMWDETNAQKNGIISRNVRFPEKMIDTIYSGPHIFVANPLFKTSRRVCKLNSDYDNIDLTALPNNYTQRTNYEPCDAKNYAMAVPETSWGAKCNDEYRILFRRMLNLGGERTLIGAIVPPHSGHISTMISISFQDLQDEIMVAGLLFSLPYDAFIKILGKGDMYYDTIVRFPFLRNSLPELEVRVLLLNALNGNYANLWRKLWKNQYCEQEWSKKDVRLPSDTFSKLTVSWNENFPIYSDYGRRQLMIEIDVLVARLLGITLAQLKSIYEIQFPIMQQYEADTWYDANGRITFTNNRSLVGVGFDRKEFELNMKDAPAGKKFYRTIMDDTMPGGPVERTIEYVAPFDRCDREQDYETAWKFFEEKYGRM